MSTEQTESGFSFSRPPLTEVAIGVGFESLTSWDPLVLGALVEAFRSEFPSTQLTDQLTSLVVTGQPDIDPFAALGRVWLTSESKHLLVQAQNNRFHLNWRRQHDSDAYPRFGVINDQFFRAFEMFSHVVGKTEEIRPHTYELLYVNQVGATNDRMERDQIEGLFSGWVRTPLTSLPVEGINQVFSFRPPGQSDESLRRLAVSFKNAIRTDRTDGHQMVFILELKIVGNLPEGIGSLAENLALAHREIGKAFIELLSEKALKDWGYSNAG